LFIVVRSIGFNSHIFHNTHHFKAVLQKMHESTLQFRDLISEHFRNAQNHS